MASIIWVAEPNDTFVSIISRHLAAKDINIKRCPTYESAVNAYAEMQVPIVISDAHQPDNVDILYTGFLHNIKSYAKSNKSDILYGLVTNWTDDLASYINKTNNTGYSIDFAVPKYRDLMGSLLEDMIIRALEDPGYLASPQIVNRKTTPNTSFYYDKHDHQNPSLRKYMLKKR